jgi:hypothetical protein
MAQTKSVVFSSIMTSIRSLSLPVMVKAPSVQIYGHATEEKKTFSIVIVRGPSIAADLG